MRSDSDIERDSSRIRASVRLLAVALLLSLPACSSRSPTGTSAHSGDTGSAAGLATPAMNEAQVGQDLKDHGYSNVSKLHRSGNDWAGSAVDATGKPVDFDVDQFEVIVIVP